MPANSKSASDAGRTSIFLVDDHPLLRHGIVECLGAEPDLWVCGQAGSAEEAMPAIARIQPDVVILDISLPGRNGIELTQNIKANFHTILVVVLSMHDESLYAERALRAGASGYLMKSASNDMLLQTIRQARVGEITVGQQTVQRIMAQCTTGVRTSNPSPLKSLSNRELEVLRLLGHCHPRREIARQLQLSVKTIESHQSNMREKLGLSSIFQLRKIAADYLCSEAAGLANPQGTAGNGAPQR
jgi:DNA-binding NarL/FixJ family response regulator